jgi:hypothetical protein
VAAAITGVHAERICPRQYEFRPQIDQQCSVDVGGEAGGQPEGATSAPDPLDVVDLGSRGELEAGLVQQPYGGREPGDFRACS